MTITPEEEATKVPPVIDATEDRYVYKPKTDDEIKEIALGLLANRYFTSPQVDTNPDLMRTIFMPLAFCKAEHLTQMVEQNINFIYEEYAKAGPASMNGYPTFFSMQLLNVDDCKKVFLLFENLRDAQQAILEGYTTTKG